jgi:sulfate transport system substrate-binding protein
MTWRRSALLLALAGVALALVATAGASGSAARLSLVAYSVPREPWGKIIQAFEKTPDGEGVSFSQSYGASGDQMRAILAGLEADIVNLSTGSDMLGLVRAGAVDPRWDRQSYRGIITNSVVVFAVRNGNPKKVRGWADLVRAGVDVVTPNPFSSGGARWNVLAAYGAQRALGKTDRQAIDYVTRLFRHVVSQDKSARDATNTFLSGRGDVLITYENEALLARKNGQDIPFVIPRQTMLIEAPVAVLKTSEHRDEANRFIRFAKSPAAQRIFADYGFRPLNARIAQEFRGKFPARPAIFRISDRIFGGWAAAEKRWFDPDKGLMAAIERKVGGPAG